MGNRLRAEGRPLREAVSLACRSRFRPVLMTSLATLMGLLPMALALEAGSENLRPAAPGDHWRPGYFGSLDGIHCACGLLANLPR